MRRSNSVIGSHSTLQADSRAVLEGTPRECPHPACEDGIADKANDSWLGRDELMAAVRNAFVVVVARAAMETVMIAATCFILNWLSDAEVTDGRTEVCCCAFL